MITTPINIKASIYITILFCLVLTASGCQKTSINGDLDGQWQVMDVQPAPEEIIINERLYYCFYMHTCMLTYYDGGLTNGNFQFDGNHISMDFPNATHSDAITALKQYGIYHNPVTFEIVTLNKKHMILKNDDAVITLRKF